MTKLPLHLESMSKADLEGLCVNCGLCCYAAVPVAKGVNALVPELRCRFLAQKSQDGETCCSVYDERFEKAGQWCLPLVDAIDKGIFPEACPYVQDLKGYVGKVALDDHTYAMVRPQIQQFLAKGPAPAWADPEAWRRFTEGQS